MASSDKSLPAVALIGATGYVGRTLLPVLLEALIDERVKDLRLLTSKRSDDSILILAELQGTKICVVDYSDKQSLVEALQGVDVVVSAMAMNENSIKTMSLWVEAMQEAGVKTYFPSEFGTDHHRTERKDPMFEAKDAHANDARSKGIKTVAIFTSLLMESSFGVWFGLDCGKEVWKIVGNGETPVACTSEQDIGMFTLEALLKAHANPTEIPDELAVYSDIRSLKQYAEVFDKVAGRQMSLQFISLDEAEEEYKEKKKTVAVGGVEHIVPILMAEGTYNHSESTANELLNPGGKIWKLKSIEEYAEDTGGRPWKDYESK